jgi:hypothetical protein
VPACAEPHFGGHRKDIFRPQGWISPVLLVDGRIDGIWSYRRNGRRLAVQVRPFVRLTRRVKRGVEVEAQQVAKFLDPGLELKQE